MCTLLGTIGPATARLMRRRNQDWTLTAKGERENLLRIWCAAVNAFPPEYRRQRNHLAWLAIALTVVIVVMQAVS